MKFIISALMLMTFIACNGGGGGSSAGAPDDNSGGSSGGVPGGSSGGDGNASYYGFETQGNPVVDVATAPSALSNIVHPNEFYVKLNNVAGRVIDFAIYQPTCLLGADYAYYSALNVNSDVNNPTATSFLVTSSSVTIYKHKFNIAGRTRFDEGTPVTLTGSCSGGEFVLDGSLGSVYSNGKMIVAKIDNTIYFGVKSSLQITNTSTSFNFTGYGQNDDDLCSLSGCAGGGFVVGVLSSQDAYSFTNGAMSLYFGSGALRLYTSGGGLSDTSHMMLEGSGNYAPTLIADIGAKKVVVSTLPLIGDCTVANPTYCMGGVGLVIGLQ